MYFPFQLEVWGKISSKALKVSFDQLGLKLCLSCICSIYVFVKDIRIHRSDITI